MRRLPLVLGILACCLLARSAPAQVLYAAVGDDAGNGLYTIDPLTSQPTLVGPIAIDGSQVGVTGLAIHPQTHVMYGVTTDLESPPELITIDPTTGNATLIGGVSLFAVPDITFSADGTLYGWQKGAAEDVVAPAAKASGRRALANPLGGLVRINLTTGAATFVGTPVSMQQQGCGLTSLLGVLYLSLQQASGPLLTVNPAPGVTTGGPTREGAGRAERGACIQSVRRSRWRDEQRLADHHQHLDRGRHHDRIEPAGGYGRARLHEQRPRGRERTAQRARTRPRRAPRTRRGARSRRVLPRPSPLAAQLPSATQTASALNRIHSPKWTWPPTSSRRKGPTPASPRSPPASSGRRFCA